MFLGLIVRLQTFTRSISSIHCSFAAMFIDL